MKNEATLLKSGPLQKVTPAFLKLSRLFKSYDLNLPTKVRLLRNNVFPVLLYGSESSTLTETSENTRDRSGNKHKRAGEA